MRRALVAAVASLTVVAGGLAAAAPAMADNAVSPGDFGLHIPGIAAGDTPTVPYGSIRLWDSGVSWGKVQQSKSTYWWNGMDAAISTANTQKAQIMVVLGSTPTWAASNKKAGSYPNPGAASVPNMTVWKNWVTAVVKRYGPSIQAYQIWNEANLPTFFQGSPKQMADLTQAAYKIIKQYDPTGVVVAASTTMRLQSAYNKFYPKYLAALKKMHWPVDAFSIHSYPASTGTPAVRASYISQAIGTLKSAGAPATKPLWDTEINYGIAGPGAGNPHVDITGSQAAAWVATTFLDDQRLGVQRSYWYLWQNGNPLVGIQMSPGTAGAQGFATVQKWLADTQTACTTGAVDICNITGRFPAQVAWSEGAPGAFTVPSFATQECDATGACVPVAPGTPVTIGGMPEWFGTAQNS